MTLETINHLITAYDVLPNGEIKPSAILKMMEDAAIKDAENRGSGYDVLRSKDMIFVITKIIARFGRLPRVDEEMQVRTWNSGTTGVSFIRNYSCTVGSEVVCRSTSRWVLVSYSGRRLLRPDVLGHNVSTNSEETIDFEPSRRIKLPEGAEIHKSTYRATLTDMDTNYHVNNTRYGDLLIDNCGIDFERSHVREFEIHFESELKAGESVDILSAVAGGEGFMTAFKEKTPVFAARIAVDDK